MTDYCAFSKEHLCLQWTDYQLLCFELEEAQILCHGNWIEINNLHRRVELLEETLKMAGVAIPEE
ncbi:hypothetical protein M2145_002982 [Lachnospiraceae bacterium PF1-21]|uniref:mobility-associated LCxxNW protein n=1 Tax=Ohessyouella blattaphilus TaxID=2949333 RepID=UPI003E304050